jgi:tRNA-2-methylthio-N6-dimethylallyladenosine synthase
MSERKTNMSERKQVSVSPQEAEEQRGYIEALKTRVSGAGLKYHIVTYGCQMNVHDSEKLAGMLYEIGYEETDNQQEADLVLFNTCCVRENAELRVYGNVGALKVCKQANPNMIIGVCGCMMQQKEVSDYIVKKFPFVDMVFGTHNLHRFPSLLLQALDSNQTVVEILDSEGAVVEHVPTRRALGVSAWVTIMYGCDNFCSYCIVPYVRGRERSRRPDDILEEIGNLAKEGYKEITLLGQNVNSYGKDLEQNYLFHDLLRDIDKLKGIERIRFMTSHPKDLSDDLIRAMAECKKVCEHLHLPIQAGSNRVLHAMNRKYTRETYLELAAKIRKAIPDIALTTDIIVGFPGETEEEFQETLDMLRQVRYDSAYTFMYSPRTGTPAAKKKEQLSQEEKKDRLARLNAVQNEISKERNLKYEGRVLEVLVEGPSKNKQDVLTGRTRSNKTVNFKGSMELVGQLVNVRIVEAHSWSLEGEVLQDG